VEPIGGQQRRTPRAPPPSPSRRPSPHSVAISVSDRAPRRDPRKVHVPAPEAGRSAAPPPAPGGRAAGAAGPVRAAAPAAAAGASVFAPDGATAAPPRPAARPRPTTPPPRSPKPAPESRGSGGRTGAPPKTGRRRSRRPKLRRILLLTSLFLPLLLLLAVVGGYLYARSAFDRIEKIDLTGTLSTGGTGTTYLIVGSDSRDPQALIDAGLDPAGFAEGGGDRSDTMMVLRFVDGESRMLSIPRDLYVPISGTGGSQKINAAYNGGPQRLVATVQDALGIPIHHYMEVDFVAFAQLVDALGGITIEFPHPAFDRNSGLDVGQSGPVELNGAQALAFVRSRQYTEVIDGQEVKDPTGDLGRVQRQQQFLKAVFSKMGDTRNPITLARAAGSTTGGLAIDDDLGLTDAIRLGWRLRSLDPIPVELPVELGRNEAGSVLFLVQPDAEAALDQFR
jgi:LCP family protein required for cell wall assembly